MLAPWKKNYDKPRQYIKKQRDMTLPTKVCRVKAMFFPVIMYGCERWTIKKTEIMASGSITSWPIDRETETVADFIFLDPKSLQMVTAAMKLKDAYSLEGKL